METGWMDGWVDGWESRFKDCLQQSINVTGELGASQPKVFLQFGCRFLKYLIQHKHLAILLIPSFISTILSKKTSGKNNDHLKQKTKKCEVP